MARDPSRPRRRALRLAPIVTLLVLVGTSACRGEAGTPRYPDTPKSHVASTHAADHHDPAAPKALYRVETGEKAVALTYDDGPLPGPNATEGVLRALVQHHAYATFFVIGEEAERYPALLREAQAKGMEVENHGYRHVNLAALDKAGQVRQIERGAAAIQRAGVLAPAFLRPPFGAQNARLRRVAAHLGERVVIWTVDPRDWTNPGTDAIVSFVLAHVEPGAIVLLHDGGGNRRETVAATRALVPALQKAGYRLVTLKALTQLEGKGLSTQDHAAAAKHSP